MDVACTNWNEEDWTTLTTTIQRGDCILLLGPDASVEEQNGQPRPLTELLAQELFEKLKTDVQQPIDASNLAQVAQYYESKRDRPELEDNVFAFYDARWNLTSDLHRNLAQLPFALTITTTPDNMVCEALTAAQKPPIVEHYNFNRGDNPEMVQMGTAQHPLVYYLYGVIDDPESLVLTEHNLLDFLARVIAKNPPLPRNILSMLRDKNKRLLFLGFGFRHWYLRILLHVLHGQERDKKPRSFALEQLMPSRLHDLQSTILFFGTSDYNIQICEMELPGFVRTLREKYEQHAADKSISLVSHDAPVIFLCHAESVRNAAESLREQLQGAGFKVRLTDDRQRMTPDEIQQELDYVVVLQSRDLIGHPVPSFDAVRTQQQKEELQQQLMLLDKKLAALETDRITATQADEQFRLNILIEKAKAERQQFEQQAQAIEGHSDAQPEPFSMRNAIQCALTCQTEYARKGCRFVFPVKIEVCPGLDELKTFPAIDLSKPENIANLIREIRRDQQRRKRR